MQQHTDRQLVARLSRLAMWVAVFSVALGASILLGWAFHIDILKSWLPARTTVRANAALSFLLLGIALWVLSKTNVAVAELATGTVLPGFLNQLLPSKLGPNLAKTCACVVSLTGSLTLLENLFGWQLGIDQILFTVRTGDEIGSTRPGLIPLIPSLAFILLGSSLVLVDRRTSKGVWLSQWLSLAALIVGLLGVLDFITSGREGYSHIALPSAILLLVLPLAVFCLRSEWAFDGLMISQSVGARLLRWAAPAAIASVALLGWLMSRLLPTEVQFTWLAISVPVIFAGFLLLTLLTRSAHALDKLERQRIQADASLAMNSEELQTLRQNSDNSSAELLLQRMLSLGLAIALFVIAFVGFLSWHNARKAAEDADWVAHTQLVSATLELALRHLLDVETGTRGYALTGRSPFLEPYESGRHAVTHDLSILADLTRDNPDQQHRVNLIDKEVSALLQSSQDAVAARARNGMAPADFELDRGKQIMDRIRAFVSEMKNVESRLLNQRLQQAKSARNLSTSAIVLGSVLGMIFIGIAGGIIKRQVGLSARARAEVNALNTELEHRVTQRTSALQAEISARSEIEARLRSSEEMFRTLLDGITDYAVYRVDAEGRVASWNAGAARINGYSAEEIVGKHISCFYSDADNSLYLPGKALREAVSAGRSEDQGWRLRKDGSRFWANVLITPLRDAQDQLQGYSKVVRDISDRKASEEKLKKQAALLDLAHDGIIVRDMRNQVIFWNHGAQETYGWSTEEAMGRITHDLLQTKFPIPLNHIDAILIEQGDWEGELQHSTRDRGRIPVASRWSLQRDELGLPIAILEINRDITDRKRTETLLRESEERQAGIISSAMDAILSVDSRHLIVLFNTAAEKMFRCPASQALGQPLSRFMPERFRADHPGHIAKFDETGVTGRTMGAMGPVWALRADGEEFQIEASISQVLIGGEKLFTVILRDVSARLQMEEALRQSNARRALAFEATRIGDWELDLTTFQTTRSQRYAEIFGYPDLQLDWNYDVFISHLHSEDRERVKQSVQDCVLHGKKLETECRIIWRNGEMHWINVRAERCQNPSGRAGLFGLVEDITERKTIAETLRESEEKLRLLLDGIEDYAVYMVDPEGRVATWNEGAARLKGYSAEEILGKYITVFYPPDQVAKDVPRQVLREALAKGRLEQRGVRVRKDGSEFHAHEVILPLYDAAGKLRGFSKVLHDISEQQRAADALEASEVRFQTLANGIPQMVWMAEPNGHIFWYNQRWYEYTGTTFEQMEGWAWQKVHHPDVLPRVMEEWKGAISGAHSFEMEFPLRGADGRFRTFLTRVAPLKDSSGQVVRWFGTNTDITERKQAEEALAAQAEELVRKAAELKLSREALESQTLMLRSVLDSIGEGLIAADAQGNFILWNPAAERIIGQGAANVPPPEWSHHYGLYHTDTLTLLPPEKIPLLCAIRGEAVTRQLFVWHEQMKKGTWVEVNGTPLRDRSGQLCGGVVALRDITQRRIDELEIRKLNDELERRVLARTAELQEANKELESFTYSVAHDLRAPLRHIAGYSGALLEDYGTAFNTEASGYLQGIQDGTHKMGELVDELLALAQVVRKPPSMQAASLNSLIQEVITILRPEMTGRQIEWKIADLPRVVCDPTLLRQVFQNLISNALKYSRTRPVSVLEIGQSWQDGEPAIFVRDNGVGFNMKYAHKLFGVFQRLHKAEDFEGTGVGLATVQRIIKKHQGRVWAVAELDRGATFYFTLEGLNRLQVHKTDAGVEVQS